MKSQKYLYWILLVILCLKTGTISAQPEQMGLTANGEVYPLGFDTNGNELIDDKELLAALVMWKSKNINDELMHQAKELWTSQRPVTSARQKLLSDMPVGGEVKMADRDEITQITVENNGETPISQFLIKVDRGMINSVLSQQWEYKKIDKKTVSIFTDRGIQPGESGIIPVKWENRPDVGDEISVPLFLLPDNIQPTEGHVQLTGGQINCESPCMIGMDPTPGFNIDDFTNYFDINLIPDINPIIILPIPLFQSESFRVATFNTFLISPIFCAAKDDINVLNLRQHDPCRTDHRAEEIAGNILKKDEDFEYDVIALQEVWDEDAKAILVDNLQGTFPHFIKAIDPPSGTGIGIVDATRVLVEIVNKTLGSCLSTGVISPECATAVATAKELVEQEINRLIEEGRRGETKAEDSGLMLFSKHPFADIPHDMFLWDDVNGTTDQVAFNMYTNCTGEDCLSTKGAGLARIRKDDNIYNVAFTHLNAGGSEPRPHQLTDIQNLITGSLTGTEMGGGIDTDYSLLENRDIFVMGDLNVKGVMEECPSTHDSPEWFSYFDDTEGREFFSSFLRDAWHYTSSAEDCGLTSGHGTNNRLDYILYDDWKRGLGLSESSENTLCVQHMKLDFRNSDSDHLGVNADLNMPAPLCSPSEADTLDLEVRGDRNWIASDNEGRNLELVHPGNVQWLFIEDGVSRGTYSFAVNKDELEFELYRPENLTDPIGSYHNETTEFMLCEEGTIPAGGGVTAPSDPPPPGCDRVTGTRYGGIDPPFYLKIFDREREFTGKYRLGLHECTGRAGDECVLFASQPMAFKSSNNEAWLELYTGETSFSLRPQDLNFRFRNFGGVEVTYELIKATDSPSPRYDYSDTATFPILLQRRVPRGDIVEINSADLDGIDTNLRKKSNKFLIHVEAVSGFGELNFEAEWETNLRLLHGQLTKNQTPLSLEIIDETRRIERGTDEVQVCFYLGAGSVSPSGSLDPSGDNCPLIDEKMDQHQTEVFNDYGPVFYTGPELGVQFCELGYDEGVLGRDDECQSSSFLGLGDEPKSLNLDHGTWELKYNISKWNDCGSSECR